MTPDGSPSLGHQVSRRAFLAGSATGVALPLLGVTPAAAATAVSPEQIKTFKQRLSAQSYWCGPIDGEWNDLGRCALLAYQKANGLVADGMITGTLLKRLATPRPTPRFSSAGSVVEVDLDRQLLRCVKDGRVLVTLHATTGGRKSSDFRGREVIDHTPVGRFRLRGNESDDVSTSLGDHYRPHYFLGEYAVYGSDGLASTRRPSTTGGVAVQRQAMDYLVGRNLLPRGRLVLVR